MPWTPPSSATSLVFRPLKDGIVKNLASQIIPVGAFVNLENVVVTSGGLRRRGGFIQFAAAETVPYRPEQMVSFGASTGEMWTVLITDTCMYKVGAFTGYEETSFLYEDGDFVVDDAVVTGDGTLFLDADNPIMAGDLFRIGTTEVEVLQVNSNTELLLVDASFDAETGTVKIQRSFHGQDLVFRDWAIIENQLLVVDGKHSVLVWDPVANSLDRWTTDADKQISTGGECVPRVIAVFQDRVWIANTYDDTDFFQRQRIRWSAMADPTDFSIGTNWIDLPYFSGGIQRMIPMQDRLLVYFEDGIMLGIPSNYPLLPLTFNQLETSRIGLTSSRGIIATFNGHFFVGQDNIYWLEYGKGSPTPIGSNIIYGLLTSCLYPERIQCCTDNLNSCLLFGIPENSIDISNIWCTNWITQAWSVWPLITKSLCSLVVSQAITWDSLTEAEWTDLEDSYPTWESMGLPGIEYCVYVEHDGALWRETYEASTDYTTDSITVVLETRDFDFDDADLNKYFVRFGIKIDFVTTPATDLEFKVEVSVNRGRVWEDVGTLVIEAGDDESYVNFNKIGSTIKFRLTALNNTITEYTIVEYGLRVRGGGSELTAGLQG